MAELNVRQVDIISNLKKHRLFFIVLLIALVVWAWVFVQAATDFVTSTAWPRTVWNGHGTIDIFGYSITFSYEGWADHDYFYHSWANQFLNGRMPYTPEFDSITVESTDYNVPYFFPPLYLYLCVIGKLIQPDLGIGLVLTAFGFITAFPIYGISTYLSGNRHVGVVAAATYLFSPIILYHTTFEWLNPAPFVFFSMLSFYLLMNNRRLSGALAMTTSALFKQTAFFFALPLIAFLLRRAPQSVTEDEPPPSDEDERKRPEGDELDMKGFAGIVLAVGAYAAVFSMPYLLDPLNYASAIFTRAGSTYLDNLTSAPPNNYPITLTVLFIMFGAPEWLSEAINQMTFYSLGLVIALAPILVLMLIEVKDDRDLRAYWRRMLFLTLLLMLCVHILSPRGIYKYYTVALVPFFSILSTSSLCQRTSEKISVSFPMLVIPLFCSLAILVPNRNYYLFNIILILISYVLHRAFSQTYNMAAGPVRTLGGKIKSLIRRNPALVTQ
ncbi:MAG: hypothetical protein ACXADC_02295 [Candidatus Thorarchaeota archaeon]|jgi:hypothetical protein